jgi:hypothetical protein
MPVRASTIHLPDLGYQQVRIRWCLTTILSLLQRWAGYIVLGILILGGFSEGATTSMAALAAWLVLPVFKATAMPWWQALPCWGGEVLLGWMIVLAWRPVLWRGDWLAIERALPIRPADLWLSDLTVVTMALLPLFTLYLFGGLTWTVQSPSWLDHHLPLAWSLLLSAMVSTLALGMGAVRRMRQPPQAPRRESPHTQATARSKPWLGTGPLLVLWWVPLQRGPARRAGRLLMLHALLLLALCGLIAMSSPWWAPWNLAAFTLAALGTTPRLRSVIDTELGPWHEACRPLPVSVSGLRWQRRVLALLPAALSLPCVPFALHAVGAPTRPGILLSFLAVSVLGHIWQAFHHHDRARMEVSQWLLILVVSLALVSEILA